MQLSMFLSATSVAPFLNSLLIISQRILFVNCFSKLFWSFLEKLFEIIKQLFRWPCFNDKILRFLMTAVALFRSELTYNTTCPIYCQLFLTKKSNFFRQIFCGFPKPLSGANTRLSKCNCPRHKSADWHTSAHTPVAPLHRYARHRSPTRRNTCLVKCAFA